MTICFYEFLVDQYHMRVVGDLNLNLNLWIFLLGRQIMLVMESWPFWASAAVCGTGEQQIRDPTTVHVFASHSPVCVFQMKRLWRPVKSNTRGAGWSVETYQESDSDDGLGQQPWQHVKDLHPHAIVTATPSGTQLSIIKAFTKLGPLPKDMQKSFQFVDAPPSDSFDADINEGILEMSMDSFFQEYGLMDPELSAAWDEDHGLKEKRARTASVSQLIIPCLTFVAITSSHRTIQCCSGEIIVTNRLWMRCYGLRGEVCMQIRPVENVPHLVPSIIARIALEASYIVGNVSWRRIAVAHFTLLRLVNHQFWCYPGLKQYIF